MPASDCGACEKLINCGATISESGFYTLASRLLCESVDGINNIVAGLGVATNPLNVFDEDSAVVSTTETTILSYTVALGDDVKIQGFLITGSATGRYKLKLNGTTVSVARTSAANRTEIMNFGSGVIQASAGDVITITAFHEEIANQLMEANLFGFIV